MYVSCNKFECDNNEYLKAGVLLRLIDQLRRID